MSLYSTEASIAADPIVGLVKFAATDESPDKLVAVAGVAKSDDGKLLIPDAVTSTAKEISEEGISTEYTPSSGLAGLAGLFTEEILGKKVLQSLADIEVTSSAVISNGGANAIANTLMTCSNHDDILVTHSPYWPGFQSINTALGRKPMVTFEILDENYNFNFQSFSDTINGVIEKNKDYKSKIVLLLNTPFDNPLGKDFGAEAWQQIIDSLAETSKKHPNQELVVILDTAYLDYGPGGKDYKRLSFLPELFSKVSESGHPNFSLVIAGSLSKSFAMYGARVGVAVLLSKNSKDVANWANTAGGVLRGTISNVNRFNQEIALRILKDMKKLAGVHDFQASTVEMISKRNEFFWDAMKDAPEELSIIKPNGGFFTSIKVPSPEFAHKISSALLDQKTYIPVICDQYLRIPTCSLREEILEKVSNRLITISKDILVNS